MCARGCLCLCVPVYVSLSVTGSVCVSDVCQHECAFLGLCVSSRCVFVCMCVYPIGPCICLWVCVGLCLVCVCVSDSVLCVCVCLSVWVRVGRGLPHHIAGLSPPLSFRPSILPSDLTLTPEMTLTLPPLVPSAPSAACTL